MLLYGGFRVNQSSSAPYCACILFQKFDSGHMQTPLIFDCISYRCTDVGGETCAINPSPNMAKKSPFFSSRPTANCQVQISRLNHITCPNKTTRLPCSRNENYLLFLASKMRLMGKHIFKDKWDTNSLLIQLLLQKKQTICCYFVHTIIRYYLLSLSIE